MYLAFLSLHNVLRWFILLFAILALVRAYAGWFGRKDWTRADDRASLLYTIVLDVQFLVGFVLYFVLSPITTGALRNFGAAMANNGVRFFAVEHAAVMLVAVILAHVGRSVARKESGPGRHQRTAIWFTLSLLLVLASIPWPFFSTGRPLLRLLGFEI
ncbi:MAG: hypothetical protein GYA17_00695 [Chloroflexi bacterium]|nr:hypothetical protein [Anaerolineaceae bacterium]NMB86842.1 hypothetical protein [Chloroflexota bacterium]